MTSRAPVQAQAEIETTMIGPDHKSIETSPEPGTLDDEAGRLKASTSSVMALIWKFSGVPSQLGKELPSTKAQMSCLFHQPYRFRKKRGCLEWSPCSPPDYRYQGCQM